MHFRLFAARPSIAAIFTTMLLVWSLGSMANTPTANSRFTNYGAEHGLAVGRVEAILQDAVGYIWLGGPDGLVRFDGYSFRKFDADATIQGSISSTAVWDLYEDRKGRFWAATDRGLNLYNPATETWTTFSFVPEVRNAVRAIAEDSLGRLWLGTNEGLVRFDPDTATSTYYDQLSRTDSGTIATLMLDLLIDHHDTLWIATHRGGLVRYSIMNDEVKRYLPDDNPNSLPNTDVNAIALSEQSGDIYVGTEKSFSRFDPKAETWTHYPVKKFDAHSISATPILDIIEDRSGHIWIGTDAGLSILDPATGKIAQMFQDPIDASTLINNSVRKVYQDKNGDFWAGTFPQGVSFFNRSNAAFQTERFDAKGQGGLSADAILSLVEDSQGRFWVGTDGGGLNMFADGKTKYFTNTDGIRQSNIISGNAILDVLEDADGMIWAGTWGNGANRINPNTGEITHYLADINDPETLQTDNIWTFFLDSEKTLWAGTIGGDGLYRFDRARNRFVPFKKFQQGNDPAGLSANVIWTIHEDKHGDLWFGTDKGLDRYHKKNGNFTRYKTVDGDSRTLGSNVVLTIHEDKNGRFWIGTRGGGLNLLNTQTGEVRRIGKKEGLPSDVIASIEEDDQGNLWLGTHGGLVRYTPDTRAIRVYDRRNGIQGDTFNFNTSLKTKNGELLFGGTKGFTRFFPEKIQDNTYIPPIVYSDFQLLNQTVQIGGAILSRNINYAEKLTLTHDQRVLTFSFSALSFRNTDKNLYQYKLEGFDKDWNNVGNKRSATYTNLDAGNYVFKVKASNDEGLWQEDPKTIGLTILPPWYATWWARLMYALMVIGMIVWAIEYQRRKRKYAEQQNILLEQKVASRTAELAEKNKDIQALLQNMRQGIFSVDGNGLVHPEYSKFLEEIFETDSIADRPFALLLFGRSTLDNNVKSEIESAIYAMIGSDEVNFSFNAHLLIREYKVIFQHVTKFLTLDWNPIVENGIIQRIMVSVRDVTELKSMEAESVAQKREIDMIIQLINVDPHKYLVFESSTREYIEECKASVISSVDPEKLIKQLFRVMHTIKGNSRTYGFSYLSDAAHHIETTYPSVSTLLSSALDNETMMADLKRLNSILDEYSRVFTFVLGRGDNNDVLLHPEIKLTAALDDIVKSLPAIAVQLGKAVPIVNIDHGAAIQSPQLNMVTAVFAHILRNAVDHGIEYPDIRAKKSKPVSGRIDIKASVSPDSLHLIVSDDGRGLHLNRLQLVAQEKGLIPANANLTNQELADLIFSAGLTTKERATDISGRGVGMDAVKAFLEDAGGRIEVVLTGEKGADGHVPFELHISIPRDLA